MLCAVRTLLECPRVLTVRTTDVISCDMKLVPVTTDHVVCHDDVVIDDDVDKSCYELANGSAVYVTVNDVM